MEDDRTIVKLLTYLTISIKIYVGNCPRRILPVIKEDIIGHYFLRISLLVFLTSDCIVLPNIIL